VQTVRRPWGDYAPRGDRHNPNFTGRDMWKSIILDWRHSKDLTPLVAHRAETAAPTGGAAGWDRFNRIRPDRWTPPRNSSGDGLRVSSCVADAHDVERVAGFHVRGKGLKLVRVDG